MAQTIADLRDKILELHPEIKKQGFDLAVSFEAENQRYALKLGRGREEVGAFLDQKDAADCLEGKKCVNLAVLVTQLLAELEDILSPRKPG